MRGGAKRNRQLWLVQSPAQKRRSRRLKGRPFLFLALLLLVMLGAVLLFSKGFDLFCPVKQIKVAGVLRVSESAVINGCGVEKGTSLFLLSTAKIEQRVAALPEVCSVTVTREFPGTLLITVQEREAAATLLAGSRFWLLDREGIVFAERLYPTEGLPVITGAAGERAVLGKPPAGGAKREALLLFLGSLSETLALEVAELNISDPSDLVLYTVDRRKVLLGSSERMAQKLDLLQEALARLSGAGRCLDLRTGDRLVTVIE